MNLKTLEYPRHLHKVGGEFLHVDTPAEAEAAIDDGWSVEVPSEADAEPAKPEPEKRGPGRPKKVFDA